MSLTRESNFREFRWVECRKAGQTVGFSAAAADVHTALGGVKSYLFAGCHRHK